MWIEDKQLSLVLHTRPAADPSGEQQRLRPPAEALGAELALEVHPGRNVLEFRLPGQDGLSLLRRFRQGDQHTPVLFLTARDAVPDAHFSTLLDCADDVGAGRQLRHKRVLVRRRL